MEQHQRGRVGHRVDATVSRVSTSTPVAADPERRQSGFGGLLPTSAVAREGDTLVVALSVEVHAEGAVLPLLVLSDAPGLLGWDPVQGLVARDDHGRAYEVAQPRPAGGPRRAPDRGLDRARRRRRTPATCVLEVSGLVRTAVVAGRVASSARSPAPPGASTSTCCRRAPPWTCPSRRPASRRPGGPARVPARTFAGFRDLVPIGQARVAEGAAVCLWALERYADRAVLSVAALAEDPLRVAPLTPGVGRVEVWDDRGRAYEVTPIHGAARPGWSETSLEVVAGDRPGGARRSACGSRDLPGHSPPPAQRDALAGPFTFGVAIPAASDAPAPREPAAGRPGLGGPAHLRRGRERRPDDRGGPAAWPTPSGIAMRVLVVDDGSPDGTAALAEGGRRARAARGRAAPGREGGDRPGVPGRLPPGARRGRRRGGRDGLRLLARPRRPAAG